MKKILTIILLINLIQLSSCSEVKTLSPEPTHQFENLQTAGELILDGRLVPQSETTILALTNGRIEEISGFEGQRVNQGEIVVKIDGIEKIIAQVDIAELALLNAQNDMDNITRTATIALYDAQKNLAKSELDLIKAREEFQLMALSGYQEKIDQSKIDIKDAEEELITAKNNLDEYKDLDEENTLRKRLVEIVEEKQFKLDNLITVRDTLIQSKEFAKATLELAENMVNESQYQVDQKMNGPDQTALEIATANLELAKSNLAAAEELKKNYQIESPISGMITQIFVDLGETVAVGQPIMKIIDDSNWFVETLDLTELDLQFIEEGDRVTLTADAYSWLEIEGELEKISLWYYEKGGDIHYQGRIRLLKTVPEIRWGQTFKITFP